MYFYDYIQLNTLSEVAKDSLKGNDSGGGMFKKRKAPSSGGSSVRQRLADSDDDK